MDDRPTELSEGADAVMGEAFSHPSAPQVRQA